MNQKLGHEQILAIRESDAPHREIAALYGLSLSYVRSLRNGHARKDAPGTVRCRRAKWDARVQLPPDIDPKRLARAVLTMTVRDALNDDKAALDFLLTPSPYRTFWTDLADLSPDFLITQLHRYLLDRVRREEAA